MDQSETRPPVASSLDGDDVVFDMIPIDGSAGADPGPVFASTTEFPATAMPPPPPAPSASAPPPPPPQAPLPPAAVSVAADVAAAPSFEPLPPIPMLDITRVFAQPETRPVSPSEEAPFRSDRPAAAAAIAATTQALDQVEAERVRRDRLVADVALSLPDPSKAIRPDAEDKRRDIERKRASSDTIVRLPMFPARIAGALGTTVALVLSGWQITRVMDDQDRLSVLGWGAAAAAAIAAIAVVAWTWIVTENARRVLDPGRTQEPPNPAHAALTWTVPLVFIGAVAATVSYLSAELNRPSDDARSALPLALALGAIVLVLPMMYSPVIYLSSVVRKIGGHGIRFAEWIWVPVALGAVGAAVIAGLRLGGAFGDDFEGLAPTWAVGVAAIVPAVMVVSLGWRAAATLESDVVRAYDRRLGSASGLSRRASKLSAMFADDGPNHAALRSSGFISQIPGAHAGAVAVAACVAGLTFLSLVGSIVMVLFWQESRDGLLLVTQTERAWEVVGQLQEIERMVAIIAVAVATVWSFVAVTNVRLASARHRNPILVAATWPAAAAGIWIIGSRQVADGTMPEVLVGFAGQAALLAVPFLALFRAAGSVGSRRQAFRITWALGVILLVHIQGLGGLSNAAATTDSTEIARLAGYLAISALLELFFTFGFAGAMRSMSITTATVADRHNGLVLQRQQAAVVAKKSSQPPPRMGDPSISGVPQS